MATKRDCFFLNDNQESVTVDNYQNFHDNQYSNFNLNQNLKCLDVSPIQSNIKSYNNKNCVTAATLKPPVSSASDNIEGTKNPLHLNKHSKISNFSKLINDKTENEESKKPWKKDSYLNTINGSTLSLHIAAYENSVETDSFNGSKNEDLQKGKSDSIKNEKQIFTAETFGIQNSFEFPRQENEGAKVPEVSNFKASQRLLNPNKASKNESITMESAPSLIMEEIHKQDLFRLISAGGRLQTFKNWTFDKKKNAVCTSVNLAKAGFVMTSSSGKCTMCPFNGKVLEWENEMEDPFAEHRDHCTDCAFVTLMDKEESEWTIDDIIPLLASLTTKTKLKQLINWKDECERCYLKIEGRLTPYIPKNSVTEDGTNDEEEE